VSKRFISIHYLNLHNPSPYLYLNQGNAVPGPYLLHTNLVPGSVQDWVLAHVMEANKSH